VTNEELLREQIAQDIERIMGNAQRNALLEVGKNLNIDAMKAWNTAVNRCLSIVRNTND